MADGGGTTKVSTKGKRLEFLDAARGIAAFAVVVQHALEMSYPKFLPWSVQHFNLGAFGVVVFFLVSGFIIPVSLERSHSLSVFWTNRFFRLYPMYWISLLTVLLLAWFKVWQLPQAFSIHPFLASVANFTMLQSFARVPDALGVYWTLALELVFYGFCSILFLTGWLSRSLLWSYLATAGMALCVLAAGVGLHRSLPAGRLGLLVTAFVGTAIFRAYAQQISKKRMPLLLAATFLTLFIGFWFRFHLYPSAEESDGWSMAGVSISWAAGYALFGLLYLLRNQEFPRLILWTGRISYSLYLVHGIVLALLPRTLNPVVFFLAGIAVSLAIAAFTYYSIEKTSLAFHRRLVAKNV